MTTLPDRSEFSDDTFTGLSLGGAPLSPRVFRDCVFVDCDFSQAGLGMSRFSDCVFRGSNLSNATLAGAKLSGVVFERCKAVGLDFRAADPTLFEVSFADSDVSYGLFSPLKLKKTRFLRSRLNGCDFAGCDLTGADFSGSSLDGATFERCVLRQADFRTATGYAFDPRTNDLKGARFSLPHAAALLQAFGIVLS